MQEEENQLHKFFLKNENVSIIKTGIGLINATLSTTKEIINNKPDIVFNIGCSGAHIKMLNINDVVVGEECIPISNIIINDKDNIINYGFRETKELSIKSDDKLLKLARICSLNFKEVNIKFGAISSSDIWINNLDIIKKVNQNFNTLCEEMEAVAISKVCKQFNIPFLPIKDISNSVYINDNKNFDAELHEVPETAGYYSSKLCFEIYNQLINNTELK